MKCIYAILLIAIATSSCKKKPDPVDTTPVVTTGEVSFQFKNMAGPQELQLNTQWYKNENGDSLKFTEFNYFISAIRLTREDGSQFIEPESYHLVKGNKEESKIFTITNIPPGSYKSVTFLVGVDSARNVSGAQTGALDQSSGMFWDWDTGYIMAKLEAESPQVESGQVVYHAAGFKGPSSVLRTITLQRNFVVEVKKVTTIHFMADILEWFKTPNKISVHDIYALGSNTSSLVVDNYMDMFTISHID